MISELTDDLVATMYYDAKPKYYWKDKGLEADYNRLQKQFSGKQINFGSKTTDEKLWLVSVNSDTEPGETVLFDRTTKKVTPQYRVREKINRAYLAEMQPIRYESAEGMEIPAYLTLPKGVPAKNLPVIILPHGGPGAVTPGVTAASRNSSLTAGMPFYNRTSGVQPVMERHS